MSRTLGTVVRGVRAPIFREGDNVVDITVSTVLNALQDNAVTARDGDVVVLAGKGHETYQEIRGEKHPFDEKIVVKELLADMRAHKN